MTVTSEQLLSESTHTAFLKELSVSEFDMDPYEDVGEELRAVLVVLRHGDRTPKQKMKMVVTDRRLLNLLLKYAQTSDY